MTEDLDQQLVEVMARAAVPWLFEPERTPAATYNGMDREKWLQHMRAALSALRKWEGEKGLVLVPRLPTDAMYLAWEDDWLDDGPHNGQWLNAYDAMLSAAPPAPGTGEGR